VNTSVAATTTPPQAAGESPRMIWLFILMTVTMMTSAFFMSEEVTPGERHWAVSDPFSAALLLYAAFLMIRRSHLWDRVATYSLIYAGVIVFSAVYNGFSGALLNQLRTWVVSIAFYCGGRLLYCDRARRDLYTTILLCCGAYISVVALFNLMPAFNSPERIKRTVFYGYLYSNEMGMCATLFSLLAMAEYLYRQRVQFLVLAGISSLGVFVSLSRSAIIGLIIGLFLMLQSARRLSVKTALLTILLIYAFVALPGYLSSNFRYAGEFFAQKQAGTLDEFTYLRTYQLNIQPILEGLGRPLDRMLLGDNTGSPEQMHSIWANAMTLLGLTGFVALLLYHGSLLAIGIRGLRRIRGRMLAIPAGFLSVVLAMMLSDYNTNLRNWVQFVAYLFCWVVGYYGIMTQSTERENASTA
jgi:hypothetical protein